MVILQVLSRTEAVFPWENMARPLEDSRFKPKQVHLTQRRSCRARYRKVPWRPAVSTRLKIIREINRINGGCSLWMLKPLICRQLQVRCFYFAGDKPLSEHHLRPSEVEMVEIRVYRNVNYNLLYVEGDALIIHTECVEVSNRFRSVNVRSQTCRPPTLPACG